jgi:hypothetical protein
MTKLQAAMRDKSAKTWRERKVMYKVGSPMKGCNFCGDTEEDEDTGRVRYTSGFQVFRAYKPWETKWTWKCWECGSVDLACWANDALGLVAAQLGKEPLLGAREVVAERKYQLRREAMGLQKPKPSELVPTAREQKIRELEAEIERLMVVMKGGR